MSLPLLSRENFQKKCITRGCRNDAASLRARYCPACFKKNAVAVGSLRGNPEKKEKKCSGHGCKNVVQGSRRARLRASCFKKTHLKVTSASGNKSALLRKDCAPTLMVVKKFLKNRGILVEQRDLQGKCHFVLRGADGCIGAQTWSFMDLVA